MYHRSYSHFRFFMLQDAWSWRPDVETRRASRQDMTFSRVPRDICPRGRSARETRFPWLGAIAQIGEDRRWEDTREKNVALREGRQNAAVLSMNGRSSAASFRSSKIASPFGGVGDVQERAGLTELHGSCWKKDRAIVLRAIMTDYLDPHFVRSLCRDPDRRTLQVSEVKSMSVRCQSMCSMRA